MLNHQYYKLQVLKNEFENILDIDIEKIKGALKSGKMSDITSQIDILNQMKERESILVDLIPNAHLLHQLYSIAELEKAFEEFWNPNRNCHQ